MHVHCYANSVCRRRSLYALIWQEGRIHFGRKNWSHFGVQRRLPASSRTLSDCCQKRRRDSKGTTSATHATVSLKVSKQLMRRSVISFSPVSSRDYGSSRNLPKILMKQP